MKKLEKLTPKQIKLMAEVRDEWIDIALHKQNFDTEELEAGVKWMYYISDLKEPKVIFVDGPQDFSERFKASVEASVRDSMKDSVEASVGDSVWASVRASVGASVRDSMKDSVEASVWDTVWASVGDSVWASVRVSVWASVKASVGASVRDSESYACLNGDAEFGAWYEYWKKIKIFQDEKCDKYVGFLRAGAFYCLFFKKTAFIMRRPIIVEQNEVKRLHSLKGPALAFKDGTEIYKIDGITFDKEWWDKIANDKLTPKEVFAIDNQEHRRIAYQYMDKSKMKQLKDFKILDEQKDDKNNPMKIISFKVKNVEELLLFYQCICPSSGREYFVQTNQTNCQKAKNVMFGFEPEEKVVWENEW